jgi:hypothetical protein
MISIDVHIPSWARYMAMDAFGKWVCYSKKPEIYGDTWAIKSKPPHKSSILAYGKSPINTVRIAGWRDELYKIVI